MAQGLGINEVVDIRTTVSSGGIGPADFGTGLLLVNESTLAAAGSFKIRRFTSLQDVADVFDDASSNDHATIVREASIWFAADPSPKALYIARITEEGVPTVGYSATISDTNITNMAGVAGSLKTTGSISINGNPLTNISPAASSGGAIATAIQAKLQSLNSSTGLSTSTVSFANNVFTFTLKGTSDAPFTAPLNITPVSGGGGTDYASEMGFVPSEGEEVTEGAIDETPGSRAYYRQGHVAQGVQQALNEVVGFASNGRPTNIMVSDTVTPSISAGSPSGKIAALRAFVNSGDYIGAFVENGESTVFAGADGAVSDTAQIRATNGDTNTKIMGIYSHANPAGSSSGRVDIAVLAKLSSQDFNQPQSIITLVPKSLTGVSPTSITSGQIDALEQVNGSVYTTVGGYPSFLGGKVGNGTWIDAQYWLAWLKDEMERNIYNNMRASNRFDTIELTDTIHKVMSKAINSGGIKLGGIVNTAMKKEIRILTQNPGFDGVLQNGYLLYIQPDSTLTDIDRANRHQSFKVWISPSDAIHSVGGTIVLSG
ncbi:MAG: DUF3383 family protein [Gammaproteobacteria bacterium AqS3]|nr:DUF3383 family protein [Gammaproteobacteria bacterium AqS3]